MDVAEEEVRFFPPLLTHSRSFASPKPPFYLQDNIVCEICLNGTVYEGNEILFCDKCNVAVHQGCYSVKDIPEGSW